MSEPSRYDLPTTDGSTGKAIFTACERNSCIVRRYTIQCAMIKSFRHDGIERFFRTGSKAGIDPKHAKRLRLQLARLDGSKSAVDMNLPGWRWHALGGKLAGHWAVWVDQNWRLTFSFEGTDAVLVDYQDYH